MVSRFFYRIGPTYTPKVIKLLLGLTAILSLLCAVQLSFFPSHPIFYWLSLSLEGLKQGYFWQLLTYFFVVPTMGFSGGFFLHLIFNLYLLWVFGESLSERTGQGKFLALFLISGIVSGLVALLIMSINAPFYILAGANTIIYSYLIAWVFANPNAEMRLFFTMPFKAKWLILSLLGINLLFALTQFNFVVFVNYFTSAFIGYIFSLIVFQHHSPFTAFVRFEKKVLNFFKRRKEKPQSKVYDIKTKEPKLSDEEFMDAMLAKISKKGEKSLTHKEKKRMKEISKKKKQ